MSDLLTGISAVFNVEAQQETVLNAVKTAAAIYDVDGDTVSVTDEFAPTAKSYREALDYATDAEVLSTFKLWEEMLTPQPVPTMNADAAKAAKSMTQAFKNAAPVVENQPFPSAGKQAPKAPPAVKMYRGVYAGVDAEEQASKAGVAKFLRGRYAAKNGLMDKYPEAKAMNYDVGPLGGYLVRQELASEILPALRDALVLQQAGARVYNMPDSASLTIPKVGSVPAATWVGVNESAPETDMSFDTITIAPKGMRVAFPYPRRLLLLADADVENAIRSQIVLSIQLALEAAAFFGTGVVSGSNTGGQPLGLYNTTGVTKTPLATNGRKPTLSDLQKMFERIGSANVMETPQSGYVMNTTTAGGFRRMTDTTGQPLMQVSRAGRVTTRTIDETPVYVTNQITSDYTVGSTTNNTLVFAGYWDNLWLAYGGAIELDVYEDYTLARQDQVGIVARTYMDVGVSYPEAFQIITGVQPA